MIWCYGPSMADVLRWVAAIALAALMVAGVLVLLFDLVRETWDIKNWKR